MDMHKHWGVFKGVYNGEGIYWNGVYNVEGRGSFALMKEARDYIDEANKLRAEREKQEALAKVRAGAIQATKVGDMVRLAYPDGTNETLTLREYRQRVFDIEEQWNNEVVFA